jgi:hypothetical protein
MTYPDSLDCTGNAIDMDMSYYMGGGDQVFQLSYTFQSVYITGGNEGCGLVACQYGSSCYDTGVLVLETYCTAVSGWNFDKILINTC